MRAVELDDDVFFYLKGISDSTGVVVSDILRERLLHEALSPEQALLDKVLGSGPKSPNLPSTNPKEVALVAFLESPTFLANRSVVDQFLAILSHLQKQNPDEFPLVERIEGRSRKYFARSEETLEDSGTSVNAKRIPLSEFWVVTNNDTNNKKALLEQVLRILGYGGSTIRRATSALR